MKRKLREKIDENRNLLLLSSGLYDERAHVLKDAKNILLIPYAIHERYFDETEIGMNNEMPFEVKSIHHFNKPADAVYQADAVVIKGGNTYRLLKKMYDAGIVKPLREAAAEGIPFVGSSAGAGSLCPTILTTNDWQITVPPTVEALDLVPFQINPHMPRYMVDEDDLDFRQRASRIFEFHEENDAPVLGILDGSALRVNGMAMEVWGKSPTDIFKSSGNLTAAKPGTKLDYLLCRD